MSAEELQLPGIYHPKELNIYPRETKAANKKGVRLAVCVLHNSDARSSKQQT